MIGLSWAGGSWPTAQRGPSRPSRRITVAEWIERRFKENMTNSLAELEQLAISTGDAVLLERVSQARPAVESAEAARRIGATSSAS